MLDLLTIVVIIVFVFIGYKKGVAKTALTLGSSLLSLIISILFSKPIAESFYDSTIKPSLISKFDSAVKTAAQSGKSLVVDDVLKVLPNYVKNSLPNFNISNQSLGSAVRNSSEAAESLLRPIIISFTTCIVTVILFLALSIIARIVINIICEKKDIIAMGLIDSFFGALVGLVEGFIIVIAAAFILRIAIPHMKQPPEIFTEESISSSYVFRGIYDSPILRDIIGNTTDSPNTGEV